MAMDATTALTSSEDRATRSGLIDAGTALAAERGQPSGFVRDLFGRVPPEDLAPYAPEALAALGHRCAASISRRPRRPDGAATVTLSDVTVERDGRERELTVVDVVNDNRAFLLDSTLAELTSQGLTPLLVAHPILGGRARRGGRRSRGSAARPPPRPMATSTARA